MKEPQRSCIACRVSTRKKDLVRIVMSAEGVPVLDKEAKENGRGAYVHPRITCVLKLSNMKLWSHAYKGNIVRKEAVAELVETLSRICLKPE